MFLGANMTDLQGESFPVMLQDGSISFGDVVNGDANTDYTVAIVDTLTSVNIFLQVADPISQQSWAPDCNGLPASATVMKWNRHKVRKIGFLFNVGFGLDKNGGICS